MYESVRSATPMMDVAAQAVHTNEITKVSGFLQQRQAVVRYVRDATAEAVDMQKMKAEVKGRKYFDEFKIENFVLLSTSNLTKHATTNFATAKLLPKFVGSFTVQRKQGNAYTLDIPSAMKLRPTFYVGRLEKYHPADTDSAHERGKQRCALSHITEVRQHTLMIALESFVATRETRYKFLLSITIVQATQYSIRKLHRPRVHPATAD